MTTDQPLTMKNQTSAFKFQAVSTAMRPCTFQVWTGRASAARLGRMDSMLYWIWSTPTGRRKEM